jgi:CHAT domain-containing protein
MLHFVPFQALKSDKGWWIQERAISYAISGSTLPEPTQSTPISPALQRITALGNPDVNDKTLDLPGASVEVENIKQIYPSSQIFTRKEASKQRVMAIGESTGVLHIAAHAMVDDIDPMYSYVLLSNPQAISGSAGGELEAKDMQSLNLKNTSLVTLSACNSGIGKIAGGDEFAGFKTAVLVAGAPRLMVSLWPVDDDATASLMSGFYKAAASLNSAQAIRQAQLQLINNKSTSSPFSWAPFILVGDPR